MTSPTPGVDSRWLVWFDASDHAAQSDLVLDLRHTRHGFIVLAERECESIHGHYGPLGAIGMYLEREYAGRRVSKIERVNMLRAKR